MKGLLIKDWKTLLKQMKVMLAITALLACVLVLICRRSRCFMPP